MLWSKHCRIDGQLRKAVWFITRTAPFGTLPAQCPAGAVRGQCLSIRYTERLSEAGIEPSVGSVGDSYDNALAETINGLYQTELIPSPGALAQHAGSGSGHPRLGRLV